MQMRYNIPIVFSLRNLILLSANASWYYWRWVHPHESPEGSSFLVGYFAAEHTSGLTPHVHTESRAGGRLRVSPGCAPRVDPRRKLQPTLTPCRAPRSRVYRYGTALMNSPSGQGPISAVESRCRQPVQPPAREGQCRRWSIGRARRPLLRAGEEPRLPRNQ